MFAVQSGVKRRPFRSAARSSITTGVPLDSYIFMNAVRRSVGHVIYGGGGSKRPQTAEPRPQPDGRFPPQVRRNYRSADLTAAEALGQSRETPRLMFFFFYHRREMSRDA